MRFGEFEIALVDDGLFALDGGSMFGIVPRPGWEKLSTPDERNRIDLALRVVLVRGRGRVILLDAGIGNKISEKLCGLMNIRRGEGTPSRRSNHATVGGGEGTPGKLQALGFKPDDVTDVVLTHLHFDHAGGVSSLHGCALSLTYPAARVHVQRACWEWAQRPSEKDAASFMAQDLDPLKGSDRLHLIDGDAEVLPGIRVIALKGHTPGMQVVLIEGGMRHEARGVSPDESVNRSTSVFPTPDSSLQPPASFAYLSDLVPTVHHIRLPYIMAFDVSPLETLAEKKRTLARADDEKWIVCFGHDVTTPACTLARNDKGEITAGGCVEL